MFSGPEKRVHDRCAVLRSNSNSGMRFNVEPPVNRSARLPAVGLEELLQSMNTHPNGSTKINLASPSHKSQMKFMLYDMWSWIPEEMWEYMLHVMRRSIRRLRPRNWIFHYIFIYSLIQKAQMWLTWPRDMQVKWKVNLEWSEISVRTLQKAYRCTSLSHLNNIHSASNTNLNGWTGTNLASTNTKIRWNSACTNMRPWILEDM